MSPTASASVASERCSWADTFGERIKDISEKPSSFVEGSAYLCQSQKAKRNANAVSNGHGKEWVKKRLQQRLCA